MLPLHPFAWHGWRHWSNQSSSCTFLKITEILCHQDQQSKFLSVSEHCQVLAFLFTIIVFLGSVRLYQFSSNLLDIHDLVLGAACIFVILHQDHMYPFGGFSFNRVNLVNPLHESDKCLLESTFQ